MASSASGNDDTKMMAALALALVDAPRSSLQELAKAAGISKATLYRFCRTRDDLIDRLLAHSMEVFSKAIDAAQLAEGPSIEALRRLTAMYLEHRELTAFLIYYWRDAAKNPAMAEQWDVALDAFFLRGQREGAFRVDIPAAALTEVWGSVVIGIADAERRGRVARSGISALIENAFLRGVAT
jgi:TetR/AcrR family transcriptional repressor of mexCD-oprJ operon